MKALNIIKTRKIWFVFSGVLIIGSVVSLLLWGLNFGIDFTGGSLTDVQVPSATTDSMRAFVETQGYADVRVQPSEAGEFLIRTEALNETQHQDLLTAMTAEFGQVTENKFDFIGPVIGEELTHKALWAVLLTLFLILIYITWAFRKVSEPVKSWKYAVITVFTAFHDVIVPVGVFSVLGHFINYQVDSAFIAAILTILGYSINDTIVVFDRTRENLRDWSSAETFEQVVNRSLNQTVVRSFNTSLTVLLSLVAVLIFGGESTRQFALALTIGVATGTYSSIFIASPFLTVWEKRSR